MDPAYYTGARGHGPAPSACIAEEDVGRERDPRRSASHPFYERLIRLLSDAGFDTFVKGLCAAFYADGVGRPSLALGRCFRLLLLSYFEGLDSERAISWRVDPLSIRQFLDLELPDAPPGHSTLSRTRRLIDVETHQAVFTWVRTPHPPRAQNRTPGGPGDRRGRQRHGAGRRRRGYHDDGQDAHHSGGVARSRAGGGRAPHRNRGRQGVTLLCLSTGARVQRLQSFVVDQQAIDLSGDVALERARNLSA